MTMKNLHLLILLMLVVDVLTQTGLDKREANNFLSRHRRKSNRGGENLNVHLISTIEISLLS